MQPRRHLNGGGDRVVSRHAGRQFRNPERRGARRCEPVRHLLLLSAFDSGNGRLHVEILLLAQPLEELRERNSKITANHLQSTEGDIDFGRFDTRHMNLRIHVHHFLGNAAILPQSLNSPSDPPKKLLAAYMIHDTKRRKKNILFTDIFVSFIFLYYICTRNEQSFRHAIIIH